MRLLLGHLDPEIPHYIGNPVGDFKARFAHGGSSVLLSQAALYNLFINNPNLVSDAYASALTETWGDKLLALTLMKIGIYMDERFEHLFNGETPRTTRVWSNRFCLPILSFHGLADPGLMREVGETFSEIDDPVLWSDLWKLYRGSDLKEVATQSVQIHTDSVGRTEESSTTLTSIDSVQECLNACCNHASCLAWTWNEDGRNCKISPWIIMGSNSKGFVSGIIDFRVVDTRNDCGIDKESKQ
jgi:hypothetical protein